jgi:hypothetical protein
MDSLATINERMQVSAPGYYQASKIYAAILGTWANEMYARGSNLEDLINQLYIQTATWALDLWEKEYTVISNIGDSYEVRRARILAKVQGLGTFNPEEARGLANSYSRGKSAEYLAMPGQYRFRTRHEVDDLIDYDGLRIAFEEMKPAHLRHIIGLLIRLVMGPNMVKTEDITQKLTEAYLTYTKKESLLLTAEFMGSGRFDPPYSNGSTKTNVPTLYMNDAWEWDGAETMDGQQLAKSGLYTKQSETLYITKKDSLGATLGTWTVTYKG